MKLEIDVNRELGALMKAMRLHAGLTQEQMAKALGVTRPHIPNMEHGKITTILLKHLVKCGDRCGFEVKLIVRKKK
jgi:DNA-binding XRE family transcriptional regulator